VRREFRHWLVGNIPGDRLNEGETFTEYVGSGPPKDTGEVQTSVSFTDLLHEQLAQCRSWNYILLKGRKTQ